MDKQTESLARQEFEKWVAGNAEWLDLTPDQDSVYHDESTRFIFVVWSTAWLSSRENIVAELPDEDDYVMDEALDCLHDCKQSLRSIGIRIKGEGV
ncbi:hypothetical protein AV650_22195 [Serratia fonticola]|nr:hypothetical protein AV650_22195 [Serratia fonticola]